MAHDMGHPPFGHVAESELDDVLRERGLRFNGNAQTFRILTKLAPRRGHVDESGEREWLLCGLDLTRATLNACLKYPLLESDTFADPSVTERWNVHNWGVYESERAALTFCRKQLEDGRPLVPGKRSAEAFLLDWSDDISYSVHDMEDYIRVGLVPFHEVDADRDIILHEMNRRFVRAQTDHSVSDLEEAFYSVAVGPGRTRFAGDMISEGQLGQWVSDQVTILINAVSITHVPPYIEIDPMALYRVEVLKALIRHYVIGRSNFAASQEGQRRTTREVFERLETWVTKRPDTIFPRLRELIQVLRDVDSLTDDQITARAISDFIAGLTEKQFGDLAQRLAGTGDISMIATWL